MVSSIMRNPVLTSFVTLALLSAIIGQCCTPLMAEAARAVPEHEHCDPVEPVQSLPEHSDSHCCLLLAAETPDADATLPSQEALADIAWEVVAPVIPPAAARSSELDPMISPNPELSRRTCVLQV